jgi:mRNA-degrading endonuclease toxin of MazEF toxin-antitoxin module
MGSILLKGETLILQRDIVLIAFPFSDFRTSKVRPAVALSRDSYNRRSEDFIAVPLTSNLKLSDFALLITNGDLESGRLVVDSKAKVDRVFSVSQSLARMKVGRVKTETHQKIVRMLVRLVGVAKR